MCVYVCVRARACVCVWGGQAPFGPPFPGAPTALIGQYMKSKQLPFIGKFIFLAILSVNLVYKFISFSLSRSLNFTAYK